MVPGISRVGVLWHADGATAARSLKEYQAAARALKVQVQSLELRGASPDLYGAFKAATQGRVSALITDRAPVFNRYAKRIADLAIENRLPSMYSGNEYVEAGGLCPMRPTMLINTGVPPMVRRQDFERCQTQRNCP